MTSLLADIVLSSPLCKSALLAFGAGPLKFRFDSIRKFFLSRFYLNASRLNDQNYGRFLIYRTACDMDYVYISFQKISVDINGIWFHSRPQDQPIESK
jgi:hypothetical protein